MFDLGDIFQVHNIGVKWDLTMFFLGGRGRGSVGVGWPECTHD
jgi:hypothetical protein